MIRFLNAHFPARTLALGVSELGLIFLSFLIATGVWFGRDADLVLTYEHGMLKILLVTAIFVISMYYLDLYNTPVLNNRREVLVRMLQVLGTSTMLLGGLYYVYPDARLARGIFILGLGILGIVLVLWRNVFFWTLKSLKLAERTIVFGGGKLASAVAGEVTSRSEVGLDLLGSISPAALQPVEGLRMFGTTDDLEEVVENQRVEHIIVALPEARGILPVEKLLALKTKGVRVTEGHSLYESLTGKVALESLRLSWLLFSPGFRVSRVRLIYKRTASIFLSTIAIMLSAPLMALIAIAIKLDSPGPAIFRQPRVGRDGKKFTVYKFRSMFDGVDKDGNHFAARQGDARVTRVGKWIRRIRVDELPQLFNIFNGDMYFVGPRPFVPSQEEELVKQIPFYNQRWAVKPGATGWAQVNRGYCETLEDNSEKLAYDLYYIKNMSIGLDLLILIQTIKILLLGRGGR